MELSLVYFVILKILFCNTMKLLHNTNRLVYSLYINQGVFLNLSKNKTDTLVQDNL